MCADSSPYHYTECGLDYVYLIGGFTISSLGGREFVKIINPEGLHKAIGKFLVTRKKALAGKEVKFLRQEMDMSQPTLAYLLGVSEQTLQKWETGRIPQVSAPADALIRLLYSDVAGKRSSSIRRSLKRIADLEDRIDDLVTFTSSANQSWRQTTARAA